MPADAPLAKIEAVRGYGGEVRLVAGSFDDAAAAAAEVAARRGPDPRSMPSTTRWCSPARGRSGSRSPSRRRTTRLVVVAIGGGALAAGIAIAIKDRLPGVRVVGVQSDRCAPYPDSLAAQQPIGARSASTICDGIAVKHPGELTLPLVAEFVDEVVTVSDDDVAQAMVLLLERSKLVVEGAGAASVAALLAGKVEPPDEGDVCALLSGGNVDAARLVECIRLGETAAGRRLVFSTVVPDRPARSRGWSARSPSSARTCSTSSTCARASTCTCARPGSGSCCRPTAPSTASGSSPPVREQGFAVIPQRRG